MADEQTYHVSVRMRHGLHFEAMFDDMRCKPSIHFDEPPPLGNGIAPNAAAVLTAAVADCLSASLAFCLRRAHLDVDDITTEAVTHVSRNERGRLRIDRIDVEVSPSITGSDAAFERCSSLFEDFCTVTSSVRQGIPVNVHLRRRGAAADAA